MVTGNSREAGGTADTLRKVKRAKISQLFHQMQRTRDEEMSGMTPRYLLGAPCGDGSIY